LVTNRININAEENKGVWLAIGLNLVLLGAGYYFMGYKILGRLLILIFTGMVIVMITCPVLYAFIPAAWFVCFVISCKDMFLLHARNIQKSEAQVLPYK
jgi:hypothetical protein